MKDDLLYLGVDLEKVWAIVTEDLPALKQAVEALRRQLEQRKDASG